MASTNGQMHPGETWWDRVATRLGPIVVELGPLGIRRVVIGYEGKEEEAEAGARAPSRRSTSHLRGVLRQILEYLAGRRTAFHVTLDLSELGGFERAVLLATSRIPYGQVSTCREIARAVERPGASQAVGQALASNPLPILIPCHRVVGNRGLSASGGSPTLRKKLLEIEGRADR